MQSHSYEQVALGCLKGINRVQLTSNLPSKSGSMAMTSNPKAVYSYDLLMLILEFMFSPLRFPFSFAMFTFSVLFSAHHYHVCTVATGIK